jgi:tight adherence protein B
MTPAVIISLLGALTLFALLTALYCWSVVRRSETRSLRERLDPSLIQRNPESDAPSADILRTESYTSLATLDALLRGFSPAAFLANRLTQAGMKVGVANTVYLMGFLALATAGALQWRFHVPRPVAAGAGAVSGIAIPLLYIKRRRKQRLQAFIGQLPAALDMIRSSLHAGHALNYALEIAVEELEDPIAGGLNTVLEEMRLGLAPREALDNLYKRFPAQEVRFFVLAVVLTREVGGNLSEVLGRLTDTLRDRAKLRQQVKALSAQGRASAGLLFMIPPGVGFVANLMRPGFIDPLFYHPTGRLCLGAALTFQIIGILLIRRIVNPKELATA